MIRREKGKQLVLCDNCEELLGIYEDFDEAKEAIRRKNGEISDGTSEKQQPEKGI